VSSKRTRHRSDGRSRSGGPGGTGGTGRTRRLPLVPLAIVSGVAALVLVGAAMIATGGRPAATSPAAGSVPGTVVQARGGTWTDVTPDTLAEMLGRKDFTLLNVKTPYVGEIEGTDLYIPFDQLAARATELPADRAARIVVYCRSGNQSATAAQTLLDLGYTNVVNLAGGVVAWTEGGRKLIQLDRS
jgi:phage shock protein E